MKARINQGEFGASGRIPTIRDMEHENPEFGRETIIKAIARLRSEGVLTARGRSSYVVPKRTIRIMTTDIPSLADSIRDLGLVPQTEHLVLREETVPKDVALMFGVEAGQWCLYRNDRQGTDQIPYRVYYMWYLHPLVKQFVQEIKDSPEIFVIPRIVESLGFFEQRILERVQSRLPTAEEAALLNIAKSSPILEVRRTNSTPDGQVLLVAQHLFVASLVEFEYGFSR